MNRYIPNLGQVQDFGSNVLTRIGRNTLQNFASTSSDIMIGELESSRCFNSVRDIRIKDYYKEVLRHLFALHKLEVWIADREKKANVIRYVTQIVSEILEDKNYSREKSILIYKQLDHAISKGVYSPNYFFNTIKSSSLAELEKIDHWLKYGADPDQIIVEGQYKGWSLLCYAVYDYKVSAVEKLLKARAKPDATIKSGRWVNWHILLYVVWRQRYDLVKMLLDAGANYQNLRIPVNADGPFIKKFSGKLLGEYAREKDSKLYRLLEETKLPQTNPIIAEIKNSTGSILSLEEFLTARDQKQEIKKDKVPVTYLGLFIFIFVLLYAGLRQAPVLDVALIFAAGFFTNQFYQSFNNSEIASLTGQDEKQREPDHQVDNPHRLRSGNSMPDSAENFASSSSNNYRNSYS